MKKKYTRKDDDARVQEMFESTLMHRAQTKALDARDPKGRYHRVGHNPAVDVAMRASGRKVK